MRRATLAVSGRVSKVSCVTDLGADEVEAVRRALFRLLERHGALPDAAAGRCAVW